MIGKPSRQPTFVSNRSGRISDSTDDGASRWPCCIALHCLTTSCAQKPDTAPCSGP